MGLYDAFQLVHAPPPPPVGKTIIDPIMFTNCGKAFETWVNNWPRSMPKTDALRASGLLYTCPREFVLSYWNPQPTERYKFSSRLYMSVGTYMHELVQENLLGPMGVLKGNWYTIYGDGDRKEMYKDSYHPFPERAVKKYIDQKPTMTKYEEYSYFNDEYIIGGHSDGIASIDRLMWYFDNLKTVKKEPLVACREIHQIPPGLEALFELKTMNSYIYKKTVFAGDLSKAYKMQAEIYQEMSGINTTMFMLICRDDMKMKIIPYQNTGQLWPQAKTRCKTIWEAIRDKTLPENFRACHESTDNRAKTCALKNMCFPANGKDPFNWTPRSFRTWVDQQIAKQPDREFMNLEGRTWA